jgi:nucleotide-binding universal stress UspA family protein
MGDTGMKPLARILAATDLSAPARHAVDRGFLLAAASGAAYSVVHAVGPDAFAELAALFSAEAPALQRRLEEDAHRQLRAMLDDAQRNRGVRADYRLVSGAPLAAISAEADARGADLLVVGARGESFLRHALFGSTASRLLRKSIRRPVLVVKTVPHEPYRSLLVAIDFSPHSGACIRMARALAPDADPVLLHAFELPFEGKLIHAGVDEDILHRYVRVAREERLRQLHRLAEDTGLAPIDYSAIVMHGYPAEQILAQEQEQNCDLIVLGKHGRNPAEELLLGSVTKHVLAESQGDVLIMVDAAAAVMSPPEPAVS